MAEEEFQESEVIFSDYSSHRYGKRDEEEVDDDRYFGFSKSGRLSCNYYKSNRNNTTKKKTGASSLPVSIPRHRGSAVFHYGGEVDDDFEDEEEDEGGEIVPPHEILGRRIPGKMAFSVFTGNGRTLKGRDLSQVRNSILRMTGFLEA